MYHTQRNNVLLNGLSFGLTSNFWGNWESVRQEKALRTENAVFAILTFIASIYN